MMKDDDFKLLRGFDDRQTDRQMDGRTTFVNFATEKMDMQLRADVHPHAEMCHSGSKMPTKFFIIFSRNSDFTRVA